MSAKPSTYIVGIIIFTLFMMAGITWLTGFVSYDNTYIDGEEFEQFNNTFNTYDDTVEQVGVIEDGITESDTDFGAFGVLNSLISGAWQQLKLLFTSFKFMGDAITGLSTFFGVPTWMTVLAGLLITVIIAFSIWSAIFQRDI